MSLIDDTFSEMHASFGLQTYSLKDSEFSAEGCVWSAILSLAGQPCE